MLVEIDGPTLNYLWVLVGEQPRDENSVLAYSILGDAIRYPVSDMESLTIQEMAHILNFLPAGHYIAQKIVTMIASNYTVDMELPVRVIRRKDATG